MIDQADTQGLFRRNHFARQAKFVRDSFAAQTSEPLRSAVAGDDSELHFRLPEFRGPACQTDRASQRQFAAPAKRKTIDRSDRGLPQRFEALKYALAKRSNFFATDWGLHCKFA